VATDYTDRTLDEWRAVRPDVDASSSAVVNRILRLASYFEVELDADASRAGLSAKGDFDTLAALRRQTPAPELSPTQLAEAGLITTGGMTSRLDRLEHGGFIERHADPSDRRALLIHLTDRGEQTVDEILESKVATEQRLLKPLDRDDRIVLSGLLRRLLIGVGDQ
jgi:DNA-binding MarR family transcriptional regulator